ncbi:MAG: hypothetical protein L6R42_007481 [Xanthoria sp. 1 TBL-2021]|nr:MAG: hypothetical protein L6R42_007481 [Xanthoria sp. 1 TBL-2021]
MDRIQTDQNLGPVFTAVDVVVFALSTTFVLLRLGTRFLITRNPGWDDATILLAQAITAVGKGFVVTEVTYGLGQHRSRLSARQYRTYLKYDFLDWAQFFIALLVTKISICLFLLRLSQFDRLRNVLYGLIWLLVTTHIPLFFIYVLQCDPVRKAWDKEADGKCMSMDIVQNVVTAQGAFSATTDFICAAFPAVLLWNVKIRPKTKVGVCLLMGAGIITGIIAILRTQYSWQVQSNDVSWVGVPGALTRVFEVNIGIIAACAPVLRPFVRYLKARITGRDPHHILRRFPTQQSWHTSWYSRFWRSRSGAKEETSQGRGIEFGSRAKGSGKPAKAEDANNETDVTISLPIQGVQERQDSRPVTMPAHTLKLYDSGSTLTTQGGADEISRDIV